MKLRTTLVGVGAAALLLPAAPAPAAEAADGCFIGSPNIIRDVTDCAYYIIENANG